LVVKARLTKKRQDMNKWHQLSIIIVLFYDVITLIQIPRMFNVCIQN